jgi:hypothetical protein
MTYIENSPFDTKGFSSAYYQLLQIRIERNKAVNELVRIVLSSIH